jgi:hypothetical protein
MEATKCLKPSDNGHDFGDRASVQAATRVNAEHASKMSMCRPTRRPFRGRLTRLGEMSEEYASRCTGVVAAACTQGKRTQHRKPRGVIRDGQPPWLAAGLLPDGMALLTDNPEAMLELGDFERCVSRTICTRRVRSSHLSIADPTLTHRNMPSITAPPNRVL